MGQQPEETQKISGKTEDKKDVKVTLFGILAGTKAILNPIKETLEISRKTQEIEQLRFDMEKQQLEILQKMESNSQKVSVSIVALSQRLLEITRAVESLKQR